MYVNNGHKTNIQDVMYLKYKEKKKKYLKASLHPSMCTLLLTKISYTNSPPNYDYPYNQNYLPFLSQVTKGKSVK